MSPDYCSFLVSLENQGPLGAPGDPVERWRMALLDSSDLLMAATSDDSGGSKTAIASITRRIWPASRDIPARVRSSLSVLQVKVRW